MLRSWSVFGTNSTFGRLTASFFLQIKRRTCLGTDVGSVVLTYRAMLQSNVRGLRCTVCGNPAMLQRMLLIEIFVRPKDNTH